MLLGESAYLKVEFRADSRNKKMIRDAFEGVDEYFEKEKKAREKWEKDVEKAKKDAEKKKKDDEKKDEDDSKADEKADEGPGPYVPPEPGAKVEPFMALRAKELRALVALPSSSDFLHWLDAIGEEDFDWDLRLPLTRQADYYEIAERLGEEQVRVVMEPEVSLQPGTMRQRNLPAELAEAGARLVLIPRNDSLSAVETWLSSVGLIVAAGLDRQVALRAVTLEAAEVVGLADRVGSLEVGKDANLIFFSGDPLQPSAQLEAVMLEGEFVEGEVTR
jgi:hypothetical protein